MAKSIREQAWANFINNRERLGKPGTQNFFVKNGYLSVYPDRIDILTQQDLPSRDDQISRLNPINNLDMAKLEEKVLASTGKGKRFPAVTVVQVKKMQGNGRRFYWINSEGTNPQVDAEGSLRKAIDDALISTLSTDAGNNASEEDIRRAFGAASPQTKNPKSKNPDFGATTLEHGGQGGPGQLEKDLGFEDAVKTVQGVKVQSNILDATKRAIEGNSSGYTDFAEQHIVDMLNEEFNLTTEMKKETTIKGIEDKWIGQGTVTVRSQLPGGVAANSSKVDKEIAKRFKNFIQSPEFENSVKQAALDAGKSMEEAEKHYSASKKYQDRYMDIAIKNIGDFILTKAGRPDMRFKKNKDAMKRLMARTQNKAVSKSKRKRAKIRQKRPMGAGTAGGGMKAATAATMGNAQRSALSLKELINAQLPGELLERMGLPALRNRTGRFRQSAEVLNVTQGARGGTQIDYTYMRNPYETFEPGNAQGSTHRDPRRLIGRAVRDIAMDITGRRFIRTRRV